jgi:hypothetical protein
VDRGLARVRVLSDVGERLGGDEVDRGFDVGRQRLLGHAVHGHRHRRARGERLQRRAEPAVAEHGRVDPAGELAQLLDGELRLLARPGDELGCGRRVFAHLRLGHPERDRDRDHPLLRAVVQIALDPAALGVGRRDDPLAGRAQVVDPLAQRTRTTVLWGLGGEPDLAHPHWRVTGRAVSQSVHSCAGSFATAHARVGPAITFR